MKKIHVLVGLALAGAFSAAQAIPVDFSGYARSGYGVNTDGGRQTCVSLKDVRNVMTHYRLGTECDYSMEFNLNGTLAKNTDGSEWHVNFMLKNWKYWSMGGNSMDGDGPAVSFAQAYAYGQNMPMLAGGTIWAGRRYYNRFQLGINDHFLSNDDGDGFGVDNINLGGGVKLNAGIVTGELNDGASQSWDYMQKYIVSVTDVPTFANSKLQARLKITKQSKQNQRDFANGVVTTTTTATRNGGYQFLVVHETPNVLNGNLTAGFRLDKTDHTSKSTLLFAQLSGGFGKTSAYDVLSEYAQTKYDGQSYKDKWFSMGTRVSTQIAGPVRGIAELGYDTVKRTNAKTYNLTHLTLAAAFSANGESDGARPVVRLYYTYNKWNGAVRDDGALYGGIWNLDTTRKPVYAGRTSSSAIGAQWEAWW